MALTNAYLMTTKNLEGFLNALQGAQAPERVSQKFLEDLEFTSSNDRLFIAVLKGLHFIDESGVPQQRYYEFLDQTVAKTVLADSIREAYDDLFRINKEAYKLSEIDVKNKLKTLTRGEKSDNVLGLMAKTFRGLCDYAEWQSHPKKTVEQVEPPAAAESAQKQELPHGLAQPQNAKLGGLHYNIEIHLPATRDAAVYDAIFRSLRDHLL
jgi:hypothetical protein